MLKIKSIEKNFNDFNNILNNDCNKLINNVQKKLTLIQSKLNFLIEKSYLINIEYINQYINQLISNNNKK